jgi:hypothetical protein
LKIYGVPIRYGLAPGGARAVICNFVNDVRSAQIDGYVQRIPDHDIKIILRGPRDDIDVVTTAIMSLFPDPDCQIDTLRNISISCLNPNPSFRILNSTSRDAMKSDESPEKYDNQSSKSSHSLKESSLRS